MTSDQPASTDIALDQERLDLLETLRKHRDFLRYTTRGLTDGQASAQTTVSVLCLGGLIKHVTSVEAGWMRFATGGAAAMESEPQDWENGFRMTGGETLANLLDGYGAVAARTDELVSTLDLDASHPLPVAPWFEKGKSWSVRRTVLHIIAETSQHAGHADIIREAIDGAKTMG